MSGGILGNLGSAGKGVTRGLQLIVDLFTMLADAVKTRNTEKQADCMSVVSIWISETADEQGLVKLSPAALLLDGDPWEKSRHKLQEIKAKWKVK